jgi:uncharacterized protein YvpB
VRRRTFLAGAAGAVAAYGVANAGDVAADTLSIPLYRQQHGLTCEAASLRMALGAQGVDLTEADILDRLALDPTPRKVQADGRVIWGNPDVGFVGSFDGVFARDGYGVYDGPIADVAAFFGIGGATHGTGFDPQDLYAWVRQGTPVMVWVPYGLSVRSRGQWWTPDGKPVPYVVTEHCVVLAGLTDTGVLYADPLSATLRSADYSQFESAFPEIGSRALILSAASP